MRPAPYLVLGLGRPFCGDEGFGARVIASLLHTFDDDVELAHADRFAARDMHVLLGRRKVVILAPCQNGADLVGTMWLVHLGPDGPKAGFATLDRCDAALRLPLEDALQRARELGSAPEEVVVLSVQVGRCKEGTSPDATVAAMVSVLSRLVRFEIRAARENHRAPRITAVRPRRLEVTGPPAPAALG